MREVGIADWPTILKVRRQPPAMLRIDFESRSTSRRGWSMFRAHIAAADVS